jgi:hypothetical protein
MKSRRKIYVILVEHCMDLILLSSLRGSSYYKNVENVYNFKCKPGTAESSIQTDIFGKYTD